MAILWPLATAAETDPGDATAPTSINALSSPDLESFARAYTAIKTIEAAYQQKIAEAPAAEARRRLIREGNRLMAQVVEAAGLEVAKYNEIAARKRADPALRAKIETLADDISWDWQAALESRSTTPPSESANQQRGQPGSIQD